MVRRVVRSNRLVLYVMMVCAATTLFAGCAGSQHAMMEQGARVYVHEIPDLVEYPHYVALEFEPPWEQEGRWLLRAPETLGSDKGLLFIDHSRPDMVPVTKPLGPVRWVPDAGNGWEYTCVLDNGVTLKTRAVPDGNSIRIESTLTNNGVGDLDNLGTQFCLVQTGVEGFEDPEGERTFIPVNGEFISLRNTHPTYTGEEQPMFIVTTTRDNPPFSPFGPGNSWAAEEQADVPLIATVSEDGKHLVAIAFDNAYKVMTNCRIPCIHADPKFPRCPLGGTVKIEGRIYFMEADFKELLERFYADFPGWGE